MIDFDLMKEREEDCVLDATQPEQFDHILNVCSALSNVSRLKILHSLQTPPYQRSFPELSKELKIPMTTLVYNIECMERAGLVKVGYSNQLHNNTRYVRRSFKNLHVRLYDTTLAEPKLQTTTQEQYIGSYVEYTGQNFNFATTNALFQNLGRQCFHPERINAQLIYSEDGCLKYYFDNTDERLREITDITFELELCSEAPFYDNDYLSDITFWVNGVELCTHTLPGDFGGRKGKLNPEWWSLLNSQYGTQVTLHVTADGVEVNGKHVGGPGIGKLSLSSTNRIEFMFGNKPTATYKGGFNLFGAHFGDYPQHIVLRTTYKA